MTNDPHNVLYITTGDKCGAGTACNSRAPEFTHNFSGIRVAQSFIFCVVFCSSLFVLSRLTITLHVLLLFGFGYHSMASSNFY